MGFIRIPVITTGRIPINSYLIFPCVNSCRILIDYADNRGEFSSWRGYMPAIALFLASCVQSVFYHQNYHVGMAVGMRIRSTLIAAIFRKVHNRKRQQPG